MKALWACGLILAGAVSLAAEEPADAAPAAETAELSLEDRLQDLGVSQVKAAIEALRQKHVEAATLDTPMMARATLRGLLEALGPGIELTGGESPPAVDAPFRAEVLDERVGYVRLGALRSENLAELAAALREFREQTLEGVILDLRATPETREFALAAEVAGYFVPAGTLLFTLRQAGTGREQSFSAAGGVGSAGVLVVVMDENTAGAGEVLAATLRARARAVLVGATTRGRAVEFEEVPLGGGHYLRLASAEALVAGQPPLYPDGVVPDVVVDQDAETREQVLASALEAGVASSVFERERAQMNEASLLAGVNPEIRRAAESSVLIDRPLQRAVDLVTAISLLQGGD